MYQLQIAPSFRSLDQFQSVTVTGFSPGSVNVQYRVTVGESSNANLNDVAERLEQAVGNDLTLGGLVLEQIGGSL